MADRVQPDPSRRRFVRNGVRLAAACACWPVITHLGGCNGEEAPPAPLTVPLADLPLDQRVRLENRGKPVELLRTADGVTARSLLCTHQGCKVRWRPDLDLYICPCHEGKFDADGNVVYGMPRKPLRRLAVTVRNDHVIVDG